MPIMVKTYLLLTAAVIFETVATSSLKASEQFTKLLPTIGSLVCYAVSFYCLSQVLRHMSLGVAYAIWCALGIILVAAIGLVVFKQRLDTPALIGIALIVLGVLVINLFSKAIYQS